MKSKNIIIAKKFYEYCKKNPELRFWQALQSFGKFNEILVDDQDPFYWNGLKRKKDGWTNFCE